MPSERATVLAEDFAAANHEVVVFARSCSGAEWALMVPGEEWPIGVVMHHIAEGHEHGLVWLTRMARGEAVTDSAEGIDQDNAAHAARAATAGQDETIALLEANAAPLERALRGAQRRGARPDGAVRAGRRPGAADRGPGRRGGAPRP